MPAPSRPPARDAAGRRKAEKSLKLSRPGWTAGERGVGAVSGSRRAQTPRTPNPDTSTGTDHVRGHNDAPTHTHNQTRAPTRVLAPFPKSRTHKGTGRCMSPDQIHKDPQTHVSAQRPQRRRPTPTAPGQSLCLLEAPLLGPGSSLWPSPGRQAAATDALGPGKVEGPRPRPCVQRGSPAGWSGEAGVGASGPSPAARTPALPGYPHPPGSLHHSHLGTLTQAARRQALRPALFSARRGPPPGPRPP